MINFTTGPVAILPAVTQALTSEPLSHRSQACQNLYQSTTAAICEKMHARNTYIMTGSGTLANEVMIAQISQLGKHGLILSNGEFGNRLIEQARRQQVSFDVAKCTPQLFFMPAWKEQSIARGLGSYSQWHQKRK